MRVGVVMTTYQGARWVAEQVASIAAQTRVPDEVLVYDDGSTDGTVELVRAAGFTVQVNPERLGTVRSLEQGLRATNADVVLLADQDDVWHADRVERVLASMPTSGLLFHDAAVPTGSLWDAVGFTPDRRARLAAGPLRVLLDGNPVTGATVAVTADLLAVALPFPEVGWHDYWLALVAAVTGRTVVALPEVLLDYRVHEAQNAGLPPAGFRARLADGPAAQRQRDVLIAMLDELDRRFPSDLVAASRDHLAARQALPARRAARLLPVLRHLRTGAYTTHGRGWRTAVVDLLDQRSP